MDSNKNSIEQSASPAPSAYIRKWWVDNRERLAEFYRVYFHTIFVTLMMFVNLVFGYSGLIIYLTRWKHLNGSPEAVLSYFFTQAPEWLLSTMNLFYFPFDTWHWGWMILILNLPLFNWFHSTITQPIKKGYKTIISWRSPKGRIAALLLSAFPFIAIYLGLVSWYVDTQLFDFFAGIDSDKDFLVIKSMESFGYVLMVFPVLLSAYAIFMVSKQFYVLEDLQDQFMTWEFPLLARQSFSLKRGSADVIVGWEKDTKKPVVVNEGSRYLHELISGTTGSGKTSTTILPRILQDLIRIARGKKMGVVALEPKGDMVEDILKIAKELGIPDEKIKVIDPTDKVRSIKFNPFTGPMEAAAESFRGTLDALSGDQDEFFKGQQNETASLYTMLGKLRFRNMFNINHMQRMYTDPRFLANVTEEVRSEIQKTLGKDDLSPEQQATIDRYNRVVSYFEDEVLEYKTYKTREGDINPVTYPDEHRYAGEQVVENKKDKYVTGAKKYLNDLSMNAMLSELMIAHDDDELLDLDEFLRDGGVLLVNSSLGQLEELSLLLGQFFIRQFQSAVFRRPSDGEMITKKDEDGNIEEVEYKRIPTFFFVDEFPLYANEAFERMLTLGRSYKVGSLVAIQNIGQLQKVMPGYDKVILGNTRNKTVFGGGEFDDNEAFSKQFGEEYQIEESLNESSTPWTMPGQRWDHRYNTQRMLMARFSPTDIGELPFKHFIIQRVNEENSVVPPVEVVGKFINETKFLKKFVNIGKIELETQKGKPLNIAGALTTYKGMLSSALFNDSAQQPSEEIEDVIEHQPKEEYLEDVSSETNDEANIEQNNQDEEIHSEEKVVNIDSHRKNRERQKSEEDIETTPKEESVDTVTETPSPDEKEPTKQDTGEVEEELSDKGKEDVDHKQQQTVDDSSNPIDDDSNSSIDLSEFENVDVTGEEDNPKKDKPDHINSSNEEVAATSETEEKVDTTAESPEEKDTPPDNTSVPDADLDKDIDELITRANGHVISPDKKNDQTKENSSSIEQNSTDDDSSDSDWNLEDLNENEDPHTPVEKTQKKHSSKLMDIEEAEEDDI